MLIVSIFVLSCSVNFSLFDIVNSQLFFTSLSVEHSYDGIFGNGGKDGRDNKFPCSSLAGAFIPPSTKLILGSTLFLSFEFVPTNPCTLIEPFVFTSSFT